MKKTQRIGHGFRNLRNYRLLLLLHCGRVAWHDQPAARLQKRTPHNVALSRHVLHRLAGADGRFATD